jgi:hypothetical protein
MESFVDMAHWRKLIWKNLGEARFAANKQTPWLGCLPLGNSF